MGYRVVGGGVIEWEEERHGVRVDLVLVMGLVLVE